MDINELLSIARVQGVGGTDKVKGAGDPTAFQRVLDELQGVAKDEKAVAAVPKDEVVEFTDAMRKAEDEFTTMMDLRRRLEDAFSKHEP